MADARTAGEQQALQDRLKRAAEGAAEPPDRIPRREPGEPVPLSSAQWRLWFFDQLLPGSALYNISFAARLHFNLDLRIFKRALEVVVGRHEMLRTVFAVEHEEPVQVVLEHVEVPIKPCDLRQLPPAQRERELARIAADFQDAPFHLTRGPLLRVLIAWLGPGDYLLVIGAHHIVADGWSLGVLARELEASYLALARGREPDLPELEIQYGDFAAWQRGWLTGDVLARELDHWRERLADLPVLDLPTDRPRPPVQEHRGADHAVRRADARSSSDSRGSDASAGRRSSWSLLAAFDVVLSRWAAQDDVVVGAPIAEPEPGGDREPHRLLRQHARAARRPRWRARRSSSSSTASARPALDAYAHQDLPFEKLVEELHPERDLSRNPLRADLVPALRGGRRPGGGRATGRRLAAEPHVSVRPPRRPRAVARGPRRADRVRRRPLRARHHRPARRPLRAASGAGRRRPDADPSPTTSSSPRASTGSSPTGARAPAPARIVPCTISSPTRRRTRPTQSP